MYPTLKILANIIGKPSAAFRVLKDQPDCFFKELFVGTKLIYMDRDAGKISTKAKRINSHRI